MSSTKKRASAGGVPDINHNEALEKIKNMQKDYK